MTLVWTERSLTSRISLRNGIGRTALSSSFRELLRMRTPSRRAADALVQSLKVRVRDPKPVLDGVSVLDGISSQPIARKFLEISDKARPADSPDFAVWHKAREIGLLKIKNLVQARA